MLLYWEMTPLNGGEERVMTKIAEPIASHRGRHCLAAATQYQNGVDLHFDWGASQFLTKQVQVGLVGYVYKEIGCDSGSGDRVGCFQSQVFGVGPQFGYIFPLSQGLQGYINVKGYGEFGNSARPAGWNTWLTFVISPAEASPPPTTKPIVRKY
jgi:Putative MetA-pathway of phenol degradation